MPIVFDNHTRGNNDNNDNGHQSLLLQQQQQQQQDEERCILKSASLQHPLKKSTTSAWPLHTPSPEHNNNINDTDDQQQQSRPLSSGNDTSLLPYSSLLEPTETETCQSAALTGVPIMASCLSTKLDEVSWAAASQLDHRQRHYRPQQKQQPQQQLQQGQQRSSSREETAYTPHLSVSTLQQARLRGYHNGVSIDNKSNNTRVQEEQQEQMKYDEGEDDNSSCPVATAAEGRIELDRGSPLSSSSPSLSSCPSISSSSSHSPSFPPSSPLLFSFPSMPSLADNDPLLPSSLLLSSLSSSSSAHTCSPLSPPDSATTAHPPLSVLSSSLSRSDSLTADDIDLDPACVVRREDVVLYTSTTTGKSGSSVAAASSSSSSLFSENSIPCKGEEPSPGQTDPVMQQLHYHQQRPSALSSSFPPPATPLDSSPGSLVVAVFPPSSDERWGNESGRGEQKARTKWKTMGDNSSNINNDGVSSPFPSSLSPSSSTSKGLVARKSEPTSETMSLSQTRDSQMASTTAGTTTFAAVETVSLPVESSEKRARMKRVSESHNTTPAVKAAKNAECPASNSNNNRLERRKASSSPATSSTARPACSYTTMIMEVFQASSKVKLDLPDIYGGIMGKYPFYRKAGKVWQSSVRHALSQSKFFCKLERGPGEPGKGSLWIIDSENKQTPNHSRKRKASAGNLGAGDYVAASSCPTTHSRVAHSPKLACTTATTGESFENVKSHEFHSSAASIPSPAASEDADDGGAVRRSGRARRPPRTKEADDYITTASHSRKPSLVAGASLSTPPSSPALQDHHSETSARMASPPPPSRKRSSSIRSDRSLTGPVISRMNHFTIDLPHYSPTMSAPATPTVLPDALPRRAPLDLELAGIPGVVTSPRIRRPPQKLAEFVSSEDFKAAPCGKRSSLVSVSPYSSLTSGNQDCAATAAAAITTMPGAEAGQRVERRGRKRARPDVGGQSASSSQQQQNGVSDGAVGRSNRRAMTVNGGRTKDAAAPARQQSASLLPAAVPTAQSPVGATTGCAPAFISLKDLELSHAASQEEDYDDEDDYFGAGRYNNNRGGTRAVSSRRHGSGRPVCQNETYEQRRLAGIQQIVVASLDWYDESDSEDDEEEAVGIEGDSDTDMGDINDESMAVVGRVGGGGAARSGCDSGFDSESDSCKGFVREAGWMITAETTELVKELDIDSVASSQVLGRCQSEDFETVCIAPAEALAVGSALVEALSTSGVAVASHFLDLTGAGLVADQDGDGLQPSSVAVDASSLLPIITGDVPSPLADMVENGPRAVESGQPAPAWAMPMIPGGILKELAAVTAAALEVDGDKSVSGVEGIAGPMEVELEEHGGDTTVHIEATTTTAAATVSETTEMKADNYMGWLNL